MNIKTLSYSEIQNLRIMAEIKSFETGKDISLYDILNSGVELKSKTEVVPLPLPVFVESKQPSVVRKSNVGKYIRLKNHTTGHVNNFLLVNNSSQINPERYVISISSYVGRRIQYAERGFQFKVNEDEYTIIDIFNPPIVQAV